MSATRQCPRCQSSLPADAPSDLCPSCLIQAAMQGSNPSVTGPDLGSPTTYTPEALSALLPQFEVLELLGQGGMGVVYKARHKALDRIVALKILPPKAGQDPAFAERFVREARSLAKLNHPGIVTIHDFGQSEGLCYLVMEFVDGANLRQVMACGGLSPHEALRIVPALCDALQYAHDQGVVHRDIKPENILLDRQGRVKVADFGLAKLLGSAADWTLTGTRQVMGTPHYMAPEQMDRPLEVDHRADIFSLGVVFYEMLTGELPLGRFEAPSRKVQVDVQLDEVVLRSLEREPTRRYQHASDVKTAMEAVVRGDSPGLSATAETPVLSDRASFRLVTIQTVFWVLLCNASFIALDWGYLAKSKWYFGKEMPYEWLQGGFSLTALLAALCGSWWYYLLVKRPGVPRSLEGYFKALQTPEPRSLPAMRAALVWGALWMPVLGGLMWGFRSEAPFLIGVHVFFLLTPLLAMAALWRSLRA